MADKTPSGTTQAPSSTTSSVAAHEDFSDVASAHSLDHLFSAEGEPVGITPVDDGTTVEPESGAETTTDTPAAEPVEVVEGTEETPTEESETETETETETPAGEEETEFAVEDSDRDFSQTAYERAAKFFGKRYGKEFDLNNASDKALLRDLMEQRERATETTRQTTENTETDEEKQAREAEEARKAEETKPKELTPEQMIERLTMTYKWAETRIKPAVAQNFASKFVTAMARAMWPDKQIKDMEISPENSAPIVQMMLAGIAMGVSEVLPAIEKSIPAAVSAKWPQLDRIHRMGIREAALEHIGEMRDGKGNLVYPNLEALIESGQMKRAMKSIPGFDKMHFSNDPVQDFSERLKLAYRVAQGSRPDPVALRKASERGAARQREMDNRSRAGRLTPGGSQRTFGGARKDAASSMLESFAQLDGDKFGAAVARDTKD